MDGGTALPIQSKIPAALLVNSLVLHPRRTPRQYNRHHVRVFCTTHRGVYICFGGIAVSPGGAIRSRAEPEASADTALFDAFLQMAAMKPKIKMLPHVSYSGCAFTMGHRANALTRSHVLA